MVLLGEKLRKLRLEQKLTQGQLAERFGVAISAIASYESCARRPSYEILIKYAGAFHVSADYLLNLEKRDYIDVSDLTSKEKEAISQIVTVFRNTR